MAEQRMKRNETKQKIKHGNIQMNSLKFHDSCSEFVYYLRMFEKADSQEHCYIND